MKKLKRYIYKTFALSVISSQLFFAGACVDFDEVGPTEEFPGSEVNKSTNNLELVINQGYASWAKAYCLNHLPDANVIADHTEVTLVESNEFVKYKGLYEYERTSFRDDELWGNAYKAVNQANYILSVINSGEEVDKFFEDQKDRLKGEALYIRAYSNFLILRYYGTQYAESTKSMPGIILQNEFGAGFSANKRSSVSECYASILQDLKDAEAAIPVAYTFTEHGQYRGYENRATKFDVLALRARVEFQMNDMIAAEATINKLIGNTPGEVIISEELVPNGKLLMANSGVISLFSGAFTDLRKYGTNYVVSEPLNLFLNIKKLANGFGSFIYLKDEFMANYLDEHGSITNNELTRLTQYVAKHDLEGKLDGQNTVVYAEDKYTFNKFMLSNSDNVNWLTIRLEEILLMRAEIWALDGGVGGALPDINLLRSLRGASLVTESPTRLEMIDLVVKERMLELVGEGERFFNWKRMGAYNDEIESVYSQDVYASFDRLEAENIVWNSVETLFRLPNNEIRRNVDLTEDDQN